MSDQPMILDCPHTPRHERPTYQCWRPATVEEMLEAVPKHSLLDLLAVEDGNLEAAHQAAWQEMATGQAEGFDMAHVSRAFGAGLAAWLGEKQ